MSYKNEDGIYFFMVILKHLFVEVREATIGGTPPVSDTGRVVRRKKILRP